MQRLKEDGWRVAAHAGRLRPGGDRRQRGRGAPRLLTRRVATTAALLLSAKLDDGARFHLVGQVLAEAPVVLVLDDFEQNLTVGGGVFLDPDVRRYFGLLAQNASRGRLLLTCRYPVPGMEADLQEVPIGPLSPAEARKLVQRCPAEGTRTRRDRSGAAQIGGHPRILAFLDGLLHDGQAASPTSPTSSGSSRRHRDRPRTSAASLDDRLHQAVILGMRDVLLTELVAIAGAAATPTCCSKPPFPPFRPRPRASRTCSQTAPRTHARSRAPRTPGGSVAGLPLPGRLGLGPSLDRPGACHAR